jgi:hypothetical protein
MGDHEIISAQIAEEFGCCHGHLHPHRHEESA